MPRKTPKPRKTGPNTLSATKNRRANRPEPFDRRPANLQPGLNRPRRDTKRPPQFPGRQGGR